MASIRENKKNGKTVSYHFTVCLDRDIRGKQIRKSTTWTPPADLTPAKAKKAAERAADTWEQEIRAEYQKKKELGSAYRLPPEMRHDDFVSFVNDVWLPLQIRGGDVKPSTVAFYEYMSKPITQYFSGAALQEIRLIEIQNYCADLPTEYKTRAGKRLVPQQGGMTGFARKSDAANVPLCHGAAMEQKCVLWAGARGFVNRLTF